MKHLNFARLASTMKSSLARLLVCMACLAFAPSGQAIQATNLTRYHMDFRMRYDATAANSLGITLRYDVGTDSFTVSNWQAYIVGGAGSSNRVPANPNFAFLGSVGAPIWILPQTQNIDLPYLGISGEEVPGGLFDGPLDFVLRSVRGPGNFFAWQTSGAGQPPSVKMIATNGVVSPQHARTTPAVGSHEHFNWGFTAPGVYLVTFQASGRRLGDATNIASPPVTWVFHILPLRPYEQWSSTNWAPAMSESITGPAADPDGDGLKNLVEYATALDPLVPSRSPLPSVGTTLFNGQDYGTFTFRRSKTATDVAFEPVASYTVDTPAWQPLVVGHSTNDFGTYEQITLRDSEPITPFTNRFYQLRLKHQ